MTAERTVLARTFGLSITGGDFPPAGANTTAELFGGFLNIWWAC
jgi:hypothetical protein